MDAYQSPIAKSRSPIFISIVLLLLVCPAARAGYNDGSEGMGAPFTAAESAAVTAAIAEIKNIAMRINRVNYQQPA